MRVTDLYARKSPVVSIDQCRDLLKNNVAGLHFYTMNRSKSTSEIIDRLRTENLL